jgi:hypothetical protein
LNPEARIERLDRVNSSAMVVTRLTCVLLLMDKSEPLVLAHVKRAIL